MSADRLAAALRELLARTSDDVNRHLPAWVEAREALAEHAELHARAANEHDAQERTDARVTAVATPKAGVNPEGCDRPSGLYTAQVQP